MISRRILESLSDPSISLDPSNIRVQAHDGASIMPSGKEGVQVKKKEISPLALFTQCYAHCRNLSITTLCKLSEVRNLIGLNNEAYLFLNNRPKRQQLFELTLKEYLPENYRKNKRQKNKKNKALAPPVLLFSELFINCKILRITVQLQPHQFGFALKTRIANYLLT